MYKNNWLAVFIVYLCVTILVYPFFFSSDCTQNFDSIEVSGVWGPGLCLTYNVWSFTSRSASLDPTDCIIMALQCTKPKWATLCNITRASIWLVLCSYWQLEMLSVCPDQGKAWMIIFHLNQFSQETSKRVIGKQCRPRSDAAKCSTWSGFAVFALNTGISIKS